ncbi:MAG: hypothetical protein ACI9WU_005086, partial [Myxococcota bacterium]
MRRMNYGALAAAVLLSTVFAAGCGKKDDAKESESDKLAEEPAADPVKVAPADDDEASDKLASDDEAKDDKANKKPAVALVGGAAGGVGGAVVASAKAAPAPDKPAAASAGWTPRRSHAVKDYKEVPWSNFRGGDQTCKQADKSTRKGKYDLAVRQYQGAQGANPNNVRARYGMARAYAGKGDMPAALKELQMVHDMGGSEATWLLTGARLDNALMTVWKDPSFVALTKIMENAKTVWLADGTAAAPKVRVDFEGMISDPFEGICVWVDAKDDDDACAASVLRVADCGTNTRVHERKMWTGG